MANKSNTDKNKKSKKVIKWETLLLTIGVILMLSISVYSAWAESAPYGVTGTLNQFMEDAQDGKVEEASYIKSKRYINVILTDGTTYTISDPEDQNFKREILEMGVNVKYASTTPVEAITSVLLTAPLSIGIFVMLYIFSKSINRGTNTLYKLYKAEEVVGFDKVAGMSETKEEVKFAVEQLKNAAKLKELGTKPCKGIILEGPPGNGKTLIAKAIAGEANVPFIATSGSDFIEMFAGLGAARVRHLFDLAQLNAPCVVFIDEIDAVGKRRNSNSDGASMEANQTLNELLSYMDGLSTTAGVFVIGATNRISDLDPALIRPGRFDKKLYVGPPRTKKDRDEIVELYLKNKMLADGFNKDSASKILFGFSGAEIEQVINDAVLVSIQRGGNGIITVDDIDKSAMKLITSGVSVNHTSNKDIRISAVHESGHALVNLLLGRNVAKVSIVPYNSGVGGITVRDVDDLEDNKFRSKSELQKDIMVLLAGRAAELVVFNDSSNGCSNDLEKATMIAYNMHYAYGMTDSLISMNALKNSGVNIIDTPETIEVINNALNKYSDEVKTLIESNRDKLEKLANRLEAEENIYNLRVDDILTD